MTKWEVFEDFLEQHTLSLGSRFQNWVLPQRTINIIFTTVSSFWGGFSETKWYFLFFTTIFKFQHDIAIQTPSIISQQTSKKKKIIETHNGTTYVARKLRRRPRTNVEHLPDTNTCLTLKSKVPYLFSTFLVRTLWRNFNKCSGHSRDTRRTSQGC